MSAPLTAPEAQDALAALADPARAGQTEAGRRVLGISGADLEALVQGWRAALDLPARVALARDLWAGDTQEGRIAAARLLTQARMTDDAEVWALLSGWLSDCTGWAEADAVGRALDRRVTAEPGRLDAVEAWVDSPEPWRRRAVLTVTLPLTKLRHPKPDELARRERVLGWLTPLAASPDPLIRKAVLAWLLALSRHDTGRVRDWLDAAAVALPRGFRREAGRVLGHSPVAPDAPGEDA